MKKSASGAGGASASLRRDAEEKPKSMLGVGDTGTPFLDYLLGNVSKAGYRSVVLVVGDRDTVISERYGSRGSISSFPELVFRFAVQKIPGGRSKPLGTADALLAALNVVPEWKGGRLTVCNSDNLYSVNALRLLRNDMHANCMIDYDRRALRFDDDRIAQFSVIRKDDQGYLTDILEKPSPEEALRAADASGRIGVSMNIFRFSYDDILPFLEQVPLHPVRQEKELPEAVKLMIGQRPKSMFTIPLSEHVPDLTVLSDLRDVEADVGRLSEDRQ